MWRLPSRLALSALVLATALPAQDVSVQGASTEGASAEGEGAEGESAEVRRHELGSGALAGTGHELVLPGRLISWSPECSELSGAEASPSRANESCGVYVLTRWKREDDERERSVRRRDRTERYSVCLFRPGKDVPLRWLGSFESPRIESIRAFDLDGDGYGEPLVSEGGNLYRVHDKGRLERLLDDQPDRIHLDSAVEVLGPKGPLLAISGVGVLRLFRGQRGALVEQEEVDLPVRVERRRRGLRLRSPRLRPVEGDQSLIAVGPEAHGAVRLRTLLLPADPARREPPEEDDEGGIAPWQEAWSRLPGPERVEGAHYEHTDGGVALLVHTLRSDRMGILEKKKSRVFLLSGDRTREGDGPRFGSLTLSRLWQPLGSTLDDVDGDGVLDLLLFQHEGFDGDKLLAEVFPGVGAQGSSVQSSSVPVSFSQKSWRSMLDIESARWFWGEDLTGDGRSDLLLWAGSLLLFPALDTPKKKGFLEDDPVAELRPPQMAGAEEVDVEMLIDIPGDGEDQAIEESDESLEAEDDSDEEDDEPDPTVRWRVPSLMDFDGTGAMEIVIPGRNEMADRLLVVRLRGS